jgi:hypothetical protein
LPGVSVPTPEDPGAPTPQPPVWRIAVSWAIAAVVGAFVIVGAWSLNDALGAAVVAAALVVAGLVALERFNELAGRMLGGAVVGTLVLLGVNVLVDGVHRPPILCGLFLAIVVFAAAAGWYLRGYRPDENASVADHWWQKWWRKIVTFLGRGDPWGLWTTFVVASALAIALLVDVPVVVARKEDSAWSMAIGLGVAVVLFGIGAWCYRKRAGVPLGAASAPTRCRCWGSSPSR